MINKTNSNETIGDTNTTITAQLDLSKERNRIKGMLDDDAFNALKKSDSDFVLTSVNRRDSETLKIYENKNKGARQYFNVGVGFKYNKFGVDIAYLAALKRNNPLANTLRFTLRMVLGEKASNSGDTKPE